MAVVSDHGVGRVQNIAHAAVVLLQLHHARLGVIALEFQDVAQIGATPRVNGLVVVAHHHDVAMSRGQKLRDGVLGAVGVLVLVHHDVAEPLLIGGPHIFVVLQQQVAVQQHVVEVHGVGGLEALLEPRVHARGLLAHRVGGPGLEVGGHHQVVLRLRDAVHQRIHGEALRVDVQAGHDVLVQALQIVGIVDREALGEAEPLGVGAQDAPAHGVEGGHPHAAGPPAHQLPQTLAHLGSGLVGEGDGEDLPGRRQVLLDDVGDAVGQHAGLAGAGAGQHQQRALGGDDGLALGVVQRIDVNGHSGSFAY